MKNSSFGQICVASERAVVLYVEVIDDFQVFYHYFTQQQHQQRVVVVMMSDVNVSAFFEDVFFAVSSS